MTHQDIAGQNIDVGDIVIYTASAGQSVSSVNMGKVTRMSAKSVWVRNVDPVSLQIKIVEDYSLVDDLDSPYTRYDGSIGYHYKRVVHGKKEINEAIINSPGAHRFYVLKKV